MCNAYAQGRRRTVSCPVDGLLLSGCQWRSGRSYEEFGIPHPLEVRGLRSVTRPGAD